MKSKELQAYRNIKAKISAFKSNIPHTIDFLLDFKLLRNLLQRKRIGNHREQIEIDPDRKSLNDCIPRPEGKEFPTVASNFSQPGGLADNQASIYQEEFNIGNFLHNRPEASHIDPSREKNNLINNEPIDLAQSTAIHSNSQGNKNVFHSSNELKRDNSQSRRKSFEIYTKAPQSENTQKHLDPGHGVNAAKDEKESFLYDINNIFNDKDYKARTLQSDSRASHNELNNLSLNLTYHPVMSNFNQKSQPFHNLMCNNNINLIRDKIDNVTLVNSMGFPDMAFGLNRGIGRKSQYPNDLSKNRAFAANLNDRNLQYYGNDHSSSFSHLINIEKLYTKGEKSQAERPNQSKSASEIRANGKLNPAVQESIETNTSGKNNQSDDKLNDCLSINQVDSKAEQENTQANNKDSASQAGKDSNAEKERFKNPQKENYLDVLLLAVDLMLEQKEVTMEMLENPNPNPQNQNQSDDSSLNESNTLNMTSKSKKRKRSINLRKCENKTCTIIEPKKGVNSHWHKIKLSDKKILSVCSLCFMAYKQGHYCYYCSLIYKDSHCNPNADSKQWVQCDYCHTWHHVLCEETRGGAYKDLSKQLKDVSFKYKCPNCRVLYKERHGKADRDEYANHAYKNNGLLSRKLKLANVLEGELMEMSRKDQSQGPMGTSRIKKKTNGAGVLNQRDMNVCGLAIGNSFLF